ncbi:MAG: hypothetical protein ABUK11_09195 [Mariprofundaceae bacterium]
MAEQTLGNFYNSCDMIHREFYSVLIHEWEDLGLAWDWSDRAVALGSKSVIRDETFIFFRLQPGESIYPAAISIDTDAWREYIGQEEADIFLRDIRMISELQHKQRENIFSIIDPGHQSGPTQQKLRDLIKGFGFRIPELVAS